MRISDYEGYLVSAWNWLHDNWKGASIVAFLSFLLAKVT